MKRKSKLTKSERVQRQVLSALADAYKRTADLYKVLEEIMDEMWEQLEPELQTIIEKYLRDPYTGDIRKIDLSKYPAIEYAIKEAQMREVWRITERQWIAYNVITESLTETYQKASKDVYIILQRTPMWKDNTQPPHLQAKAEVRITDTYITSQVLPIPWCSDGKTYSQRLYEHTANFQKKLDFVLREGLTNGKGMEWMQWAWRQLTNATAYDTARLIKTETMAFYNKGLLDTYLEAGVEYVEIVGDAECGGICLDYVDEGPIRLEGAQINVELPPYHPNCACSFVEWEEEEGKIEQEEYDDV